MGHLINPIAFRLGHSRSWEDNWYVKHIYYPEFLYSIIKIRHYLNYFWTTRYMEKKGILLSHFYIYKFVKNLLIKIFLYNIDLEKKIYSFFARGTSTFSEAFYYRLKRKKKKKEPFLYERYKPDLFFLLFLYYAFFSKRRRRRRKIRKGFRYVYKLVKKKKKENVQVFFKEFLKKKRDILSLKYLTHIKKGNLKFFIKLPEHLKKKNEYLDIPFYEDKIKKINSKKINLGFFDFLIYLFFKINMLEKQKEDILNNRKRRRSWEMVPNFIVKIKRWVKLLKKFVIIKVKVSSKRKKSIKSFIFFLTFIIKFYYKAREKSSRIGFRLKDFNLRLLKIFFFNKILTRFALFYGKFLRHILYLLTNINKYSFKFCFITNNSVNARFLVRYIGLKLKRKFPLFSVINPLKKELKKLSFKKRQKKSKILSYLFDCKVNDADYKNTYKESFRNVLLYLNNKYMDFSMSFYKNSLTFITFDIFINWMWLNDIYGGDVKVSRLLKKLFFFLNEKKFLKKKKYFLINFRWNRFIAYTIIREEVVLKRYLLIKKKIYMYMYMFFKNKLFVNLFFGFNKYSLDNLSLTLFFLKFDIKGFFFINKNLIFLLIYSIFNNYIYVSVNTLLHMNFRYSLLSDYFFNTFLYYVYAYYSLDKFINYSKINKKLMYQKTKELYKLNSFILGFKMSFKGRFTRKQRASSIWFHQGFVPLNTIKGYIDYAFFTIPLKNSAVSIKLWLYKNSNRMIWQSKFLNRK